MLGNNANKKSVLNVSKYGPKVVISQLQGRKLTNENVLAITLYVN